MILVLGRHEVEFFQDVVGDVAVEAASEWQSSEGCVPEDVVVANIDDTERVKQKITKTFCLVAVAIIVPSGADDAVLGLSVDQDVSVAGHFVEVERFADLLESLSGVFLEGLVDNGERYRNVLFADGFLAFARETTPLNEGCISGCRKVHNSENVGSSAAHCLLPELINRIEIDWLILVDACHLDSH